MFYLEIKDGNKVTKYSVDFTPTAEAAQEAVEKIGSVIKEIFPKFTKEVTNIAKKSSRTRSK